MSVGYQKTVWKNRIVEFPNRYTIVNNGDGTSTVTKSEGNITEIGTPISQNAMNKIEQGILDNEVLIWMGV